MTQVFISHASQDRAQAQRLALALQQRGYEVWWGRELMAGQAFDKTIEQALARADCAVVMWSSHAVASNRVRAEASAAAERDALVPAWIEPVELPVEFQQRHTVDLCTWQGQTEHPGFHELCRGIDARREGARLSAAAHIEPAANPADDEAPKAHKVSLASPWIWRAGAVFTVLAGLAVWWSVMHLRAAQEAVAASATATPSASRAASTSAGALAATGEPATAREATRPNPP